MAKYYKLLKDLPTFKKGELFYLSKAGNLMAVGPKSQVIACTHSTLEHFPNILKDWFEGVEDPNGRWEPEKRDCYYYIRSYGTGCVVASVIWYNDDFDRATNELGNVFRTEEEAEKAVEWLKARKVLFDDAKGFKPNWKDDEELKCTVEYICGPSRQPKLEVVGMRSENTTPGPYFATREDAKASIKAHEKEWKIYLGVEELWNQLNTTTK